MQAINSRDELENKNSRRAKNKVSLLCFFPPASLSPPFPPFSVALSRSGPTASAPQRSFVGATPNTQSRSPALGSTSFPVPRLPPLSLDGGKLIPGTATALRRRRLTQLVDYSVAQTRRTTRRSTAVTNNNENSLAATGQLSALAQPVKRQIAPKGKTLVNKSVSFRTPSPSTPSLCSLAATLCQSLRDSSRIRNNFTDLFSCDSRPTGCSLDHCTDRHRRHGCVA